MNRGHFILLAAVFLLSLSSLAFEVLLARIFAVSQWNHLSFMVISIALFGFGGSGTFLSLLDARKRGWEQYLSSEAAVGLSLILYALTAMGAFVVLNRLPLDYARLPVEPVQTAYLLITYLMLILPFFFAGLVMSVAYAAIPEKAGLTYFASMAGSALGAILPGLCLPLTDEGPLLLLTALMPLPLLAVILPVAGRKTKRLLVSGGLGGLILALLLLTVGKSLIQVLPSPYKALSQMARFPDTRITRIANGLRGRIDRAESLHIRFAPGLSLRFSGTLPEQKAIFRDGDSPFFLYDLSEETAADFAKYSLSYAGYLLTPEPERLLLIQHGGGAAIPCAIAAYTGEITVLASHPSIREIIREHYGLRVSEQEARAFLARSRERFSVIHLENWGTSLPGSAALNQEYDFTLRAFAEYLSHLTPSGVLILSRKLLLPPSDLIRMWGTAYEALRATGITKPENHLAVLRNWDTYTLIVSIRPLGNASELRAFAREMNFDAVWLPDMSPDMANRFNRFDAPYHFSETRGLLQAYRSGRITGYYKAGILDTAPQSDRRPFPSRFLRWSRLKELYRSTGERPYSLLMSGEIVIAVVFAEASGVAVLLLLLPLFFVSRSGDRIRPSQVLFFLGIGAGFMFAEIFFIKSYILLLGDPLISFAVVLTGILIFSGIGGFCSQKMGERTLRYWLMGLLALMLALTAGLDLIISRVLGFPPGWRYLIALILLLPPGFLMGLPFSLGMRYLLRTPRQRAYGWAANGCASVLTSVMAAQIAISMGIPAVMACGCLAYLAALLSVIKNSGP